jgi:glucose-fructose oxidoreductase
MRTSISRREVVKALSLGSAGLLLSPRVCFLPVGHRSKTWPGCGSCGLGYYSTDLLAPALQQTKNCYLAGIVTGSSSKAESWKKQ